MYFISVLLHVFKNYFFPLYGCSDPFNPIPTHQFISLFQMLVDIIIYIWNSPFLIFYRLLDKGYSCIPSVFSLVYFLEYWQEFYKNVFQAFKIEVTSKYVTAFTPCVNVFFIVIGNISHFEPAFLYVLAFMFTLIYEIALGIVVYETTCCWGIIIRYVLKFVWCAYCRVFLNKPYHYGFTWDYCRGSICFWILFFSMVNASLKKPFSKPQFACIIYKSFSVCIRKEKYTYIPFLWA